MYPFRSTEAKWRKIWEDNYADATPSIVSSSDKKCYVLEMLPYPSGKIHMGHVRNYCIGDVIARYKKAQGYKVLHPMGWDAFGMPAENAALQNGAHPRDWTYSNIESMKQVLLPLGLSYDWDREIATCSDEYYGHEQRLFIEMHEKGLVYRKDSWVNWDPVDNTVLANEQVIDGKGWRSGAVVVKKQLEHWCLRITAYADELLQNLEQLKIAEERHRGYAVEGWPEKVLIMQENWIGKSEGLSVNFEICEGDFGEIVALTVFTTRPETLFGASFCAIACGHPLAERLAQTDAGVAAFIQECQRTPATEQAQSTAEKMGYRSKITVRNPINPIETIPVFVANFVLMEYGTGAIFGCPAHDERDFAFAEKYKLPIRSVIHGTSDSLPYVELDGTMVNSSFLDGMTVLDARKKASDYIESLSSGVRQTTYRLRDWSVSRQRYWGCPIPMIHCEHCGIVPVPKEDLPVKLPADVSFNEPGNPLDKHPTWKHVKCPKCGAPATRETDTLDTFFESSWYFLRNCCPHDAEPVNKEALNTWMPVDVYIGGVEHAVLHLLYARFFTMVLNDLGYINLREPFATLMTQGMVCHMSYQDENGKWLGPDEIEKDASGGYVTKDGGRPVIIGRAEKMSKSKKNLVNPEQMVETYGADALRIFIMSDTPYEKDFDWNTEALEGAWRYLNKVWRICEQLCEKYTFSSNSNDSVNVNDVSKGSLLATAHKYLQRIEISLNENAFHKAIALHRELTRELEREIDAEQGSSLSEMAEVLKIWISVLMPFAPHISMEAYHQLFKPSDLMMHLPWPVLRPELAFVERVTIAVQVNGRLRATFDADVDVDTSMLSEEAQALSGIQKFIDGKVIKNIVIVKNKLVNIVVE
ncbi:MAG: leucine--tRNA ligase [Holosporales bacterium]|jgi:leucyl-tRNA synthetase|nr:leucine--tRNA ligase [Holosporales bacterium]